MRRPRSWRRSSRALAVRITFLAMLANLPLLLSLAIGLRFPLILAGLLVFTVTVIALGVTKLIGQPLAAVRAAADNWRSGRPFEVNTSAPLPAELRGLVLAFKRSTRLLTRREAQLQAAMQQQEQAMQEVHHRVKNNLQVIASLLNLQASRIREPGAQAEFQAARDRVRALATLHRHLYAHGGLHTINMRTFLLELCEQLFHTMGEAEGERLRLDIEAPELEMSSDQAVPLALIVTEAVSNATKYAYPEGRSGTISVRLRREGDMVALDIADDGVGILAGRAVTGTGMRDGIGISLINGFARQLGASLEVEHGPGTRYSIRLKLRRDRPDAPLLGSLAAGRPLRNKPERGTSGV